MSHYVIDIDYKRVAHAGSKAPSDAVAFLRENGFRSLRICSVNTLKYLVFPFDFLRIYFRLGLGDVVVFQYPVHSASNFRVVLRLARELGRKGVKRIALVHDVDFGRNFGNVSDDEELRRLSLFDLLIVHSEQMIALLRKRGCNVPCRVLGLFDYKATRGNELERFNAPDVVFAGNLSKSGFVVKLPGIASSSLRFVLYGIGGKTLPVNEFVRYNGMFSPDDLSCIEGSWGLVWDGDETSSCSGSFGEYLKFNSPHKASLYLCAGLPIIVPEGAAIAEIVLREGIGIVVKSIDSLDLSAVPDEDYEKMKKAVSRYAQRLLAGQNLISAIEGCLFPENP